MNKWLRRITEMREKYGTTFKTLQDVRNFQRKYGLQVDGKIGEQTEKKIRELYEQHPPKGSDRNPIQLEEVVVTAKRPDKRNALQRAWDDFKENDPIFGKRRQRLVAKHYGPDNPFRQGNDLVANAIIDAGLTAMTGVGVGNLVKSVATQGVKALPALAATVGGAAVGQQAFDTAVEGATGASWDEHLTRAGMDPYGRALFAPGAWAGSYGAGKVTNAVVNNARPWMENSLPRLTMTPQGPVMLQPGQSLTLSGRPVGFQNAGQGNFGYQARFTTKSGGGRGSAAGQSGRVQTSQGNGNQRIPGGVQNRVMSDIVPGRNGGTQTFSFEPTLFPTTPPWSGWLPWMGEQYVPPVPVVAPPVEAPVEDFRLEEIRPYEDPFLKWYAKQPEGTTQTYSGDPIHKAGQYVIRRTKADPRSTVRLVGDNQGFVVPDSTTIQYNTSAQPQVNILPGGVPAEATRSTEKITGYKIGGKLYK